MSDMMAKPTDRIGPNSDPNPIRFPPIPLLSGDSFDSAGEAHRIETVSMTIIATDGTTAVVPLEYRHGGWWVPGHMLDGSVGEQ